MNGTAMRADHEGEVRWLVEFADGVLALVRGDGEILMRGWRSRGERWFVIGRDRATGKVEVATVRSS